MLLRIIRLLRGYVVFQIFGKFPERFINVCIQRGRFIFDAVPGKECFTASLLLSDYRCIRPLARRSGVRLKVKERHGLPFFLSRYKNRKGILYGALAYLLIIIIMQSFVWTVDINGIKTLSTSQMESILAENGLETGAFKGGLDLHFTERNIMQRVDKISWMSINIIGTKAEVEIKEKEVKPDIIESDVPCNVKAKCDGLIVSMNVKRGSTEIPVGSAVKEGQLVVSGVVKNNLDDIFFVHADAEIMAQTTGKENFYCSKNLQYKTVSEINKRRNFDFFWLSIPIKVSSVSGEYTSLTTCKRLKLNNTSMPVGITEEICTSYKEVNFTRDETSAQKTLMADEALYRLFVLKDCEEVEVSTDFRENEENFCYEVVYTCLEDIACTENIIVN